MFKGSSPMPHNTRKVAEGTRHEGKRRRGIRGTPGVRESTLKAGEKLGLSQIQALSVKRTPRRRKETLGKSRLVERGEETSSTAQGPFH